MRSRERPSGSFNSKPALSAFALPVSTTTDVSPSSSKLQAAAVSWRIAAGDSALMPSTRSNRTTAILRAEPFFNVDEVRQFRLLFSLRVAKETEVGMKRIFAFLLGCTRASSALPAIDLAPKNSTDGNVPQSPYCIRHLFHHRRRCNRAG
jgi:hypothetical protein